MHDPDNDDAPLFRLYWENSSLNPTRAAVLRESIAVDAARPYAPYRPGYAAAPLPLPDGAASPLAPVWQARRSQRAFADAPLTLAQLGRLLAPCAARADGTRMLPSGGAKYPLLVYVVLGETPEAPALSQQLAWYDPLAHGLAPLGAAPGWQEMAALLGVTDWPAAPAAVLFLVAHADAMLTKYGERGGRFVLIEAGGYMTAILAEAAAAGLGAVALGSFDDAAALRLLALDPDRHLMTLALACGQPA